MYRLRAAALLAALGLTVFAAGCSGGGGNGATPPLTNTGDPGLTQQNLPTTSAGLNTGSGSDFRSADSIVRNANGTVTIDGTVVAIKSSTEFEVQGGEGVGFLNIYTTSSTVKNYNGKTLADGVTVSVIGTGSPATSVTATSVTIGSGTTPQGGSEAPAPSGGQIQVSGPIVAVKGSSEFEIHGGAGVGYLNIYTTSSTIDYFNGLSLSVGVNATINGTGSPATSVTAANITLESDTSSPAPIASPQPAGPISGVPSHVQTADYFEGYFGTTKVSPSQAAPYLTWAQTTTADSTAIADAGIKTQIYLDPNREASTDPIYGYIKNESSAFAHNCSSSTVTMQTGSLVQDVTNPASSALRTAVSQYTAAQKADGHVDMIFEDNGGFLAPDDTYPNGMPCGYSDASWITATQGMDQDSAIPIMVNGLNLYTETALSPVIGLVKGSSNTVGGNMEHCFTDNSRAIQYGTAWTDVQNTAIQIVGDGKYYECMARNTNPASLEITPRLFTIASFLMTYDPNHSILQEEFATNTGLDVMPESELVPLDPVQTATSSITQLRTATGVYARQFNACYLRGSSVGACVVAVNNDDVSERFPYSGYTHTLAISGSGVLDGGSVSTSGGAPPTTLAPGAAVIAFK